MVAAYTSLALFTLDKFQNQILKILLYKSGNFIVQFPQYILFLLILSCLAGGNISKKISTKLVTVNISFCSQPLKFKAQKSAAAQTVNHQRV